MKMENSSEKFENHIYFKNPKLNLLRKWKQNTMSLEQ